MTLPLLLVILVALQRLAELVLDRRNTAELRRRGAVEHGAGHYPLIVLLHAAWLLALTYHAIRWPQLHSVFLVAFLALQPLRWWVLHSLGRRWTTRVLVLPRAPLVRTGPYRWLDHPNYAVVALEIPLLALALDSPPLALVFGLANGILLVWRLRVETHALAISGPDGRPSTTG